MARMRGKQRTMGLISSPSCLKCVRDLTIVTAFQTYLQKIKKYQENSPPLPYFATGEQELEMQGKKETWRLSKQTPHFTNEETEAQRGEVTYLRPQLWEMTETGLEREQLEIQANVLSHCVTHTSDDLGQQEGGREGDPTAPSNENNKKDLRHS